MFVANFSFVSCDFWWWREARGNGKPCLAQNTRVLSLHHHHQEVPPPPPPLEKLHGCSTVVARALRPSRQESQTAQRRPLGPDTNSSPQSCTVRAATLRVRHFPPKPLEELHRCSPSVCDHFVRDSARVPLPFNTGCCRARMFHECMPNVLTRYFTT
jgi:hypothetical protein